MVLFWLGYSLRLDLVLGGRVVAYEITYIALQQSTEWQSARPQVNSLELVTV